MELKILSLIMVFLVISAISSVNASVGYWGDEGGWGDIGYGGSGNSSIYNGDGTLYLAYPEDPGEKPYGFTGGDVQISNFLVYENGGYQADESYPDIGVARVNAGYSKYIGNLSSYNLTGKSFRIMFRDMTFPSLETSSITVYNYNGVDEVWIRFWDRGNIKKPHVECWANGVFKTGGNGGSVTI
ncbi:MAG: hypothetical protein LBT10_01080 [Methanobrevibacter sp.]|jgi:hypothetical protein|nr:hypothetical protein [Methanobrevibacter sp.]